MHNFLLFMGFALTLGLQACSEHSHDDGSHTHDAPAKHDSID